MQSNPIDDKPLYRRGYDIMQGTLIPEFGLSNCPIAIKFFYAQMEVDHFKKWHKYTIPENQASFSEFEHIVHTQEKIFFLEGDSLNCDTALSHFNWQKSDGEKPSQQLQPGLLGIAMSPLKDALYVADTIHFRCDQTQAGKIIEEWQKVSGVPPLTVEKENALSCEGCVAVHNENLATVIHSCPKADTATSDEADLYTVILPADHLKHFVDGINERKISLGPSPLSRPGDGFFRINLG